MNKYTFLLLSFCLAVVVKAGETPRLPQADAEPLNVRIATYRGDRDCAISYTFDDGLEEHYRLAAPELEKRGFRGTFWINGHNINENPDSIVFTDRMNWAGMNEMAAKGHEISNHSWSHKKLTTLDDTAMWREIRKNDSIIQARMGTVPKTFCYPYNSVNEKVIAAASEGRVGTRTKQFAIGSKSTPELLEQKVQFLLEEKQWGVAMTHGITYGYDAFADPTVFWNHLDRVKALQDRIWVGTFCEVAAYTEEQKGTSLHVSQRKNELTIVPQYTFNSDLFIEPLTAVIENPGTQRITAKQGKKELKVTVYPDKVCFDFAPAGGPIVVKLH